VGNKQNAASSELVESVVSAHPDTSGDPTIDISSPAPGASESIAAGAFTVSGNVQPATATVTVGLQQSDHSTVWANPKNPVPDGSGDWTTQVSPTVTGQASLGAQAKSGTVETGTAETITITN
jgi:hypothetical protein